MIEYNVVFPSGNTLIISADFAEVDNGELFLYKDGSFIEIVAHIKVYDLFYVMGVKDDRILNA